MMTKGLSPRSTLVTPRVRLGVIGHDEPTARLIRTFRTVESQLQQAEKVAIVAERQRSALASRYEQLASRLNPNPNIKMKP
jgi:hypothetical protein